MYLASDVKDVGLGQPLNSMIAILELPMETCVNADYKNQTTGTVNPGTALIGKLTEVGLDAEIPVNTRSGTDTGDFTLCHRFVDDLFSEKHGGPISP